MTSKQNMVTAYTVYFDASGHPDDRGIFCVSGLGSTTRKWLRFETQWNALLKKYGIAPPFHMTDFANCVGQYRKLDQNKRNEFHAQAIKVMKINANKSFSVGVAVAEFKQIQTEYQVPDDPPYSWCALLACRHASRWLQRNGRPFDTVQFVFEDGDKHRGRFLNRWKELFPRLNPPKFLSKLECVPLQAADMLAWELRRFVLDKQSSKPLPRRSYAEMWQQIPHDWNYYPLGDLLRFCEQQGFPRRVEVSFNIL